MKLTPKAYGTVVQKHKAGISAVSTWRPKGSTAKHHDSAVEGEAIQLPGLETPKGEVDGEGRGRGGSPVREGEVWSPLREVEVSGSVLGVEGMNAA